MCEKYQWSKNLTPLDTLLSKIVVQFIGMIVYRSLADWTKELHDSRIVAPLCHKGDLKKCYLHPRLRLTYCHDSRPRKVFCKQIPRPQHLAFGPCSMPPAVQSVNEDNVHIRFMVAFIGRWPENVLAKHLSKLQNAFISFRERCTNPNPFSCFFLFPEAIRFCYKKGRLTANDFNQRRIIESKYQRGRSESKKRLPHDILVLSLDCETNYDIKSEERLGWNVSGDNKRQGADRARPPPSSLGSDLSLT